MDNPFFQIGIVFIIATGLGVMIRYLKQPLILAYIVTGFLLGTLGMAKVAPQETIILLSKFGIAFLLFMVGLELRLTDLKQAGKAALMTSFGYMIITSFFGFLLCRFLGFGLLSSVYIGLALTFSSTVIVIKLLSEKNDLNALYGKVAISLLLVQDFVAILFLMFLSGFQNQIPADFWPFILIFVKGLGLFLLVLILIKQFIPFLFQTMAKNQELLFLGAVAWCFLLASVSLFLGFSLEIGAFLAGVSLSNLPYHYQISSRIKPLRDLFIALFFAGIGMQMVLISNVNLLFPAVVLSVFILASKPLITLLTMGVLGFRKRTSFLTAMTQGQISEFSLILLAMGQGLGHVSSTDVSLLTTVGIITIILSTYMILGGQKIYLRLAPALAIFERKEPFEKRIPQEKLPEDHILLIGCHRTGRDILEYLQKNKKNYLVLDFDPEVIEELEAQGIPCVFGDAADEEILDQLNIEKARIIISTDPHLEDNLVLISRAKARNTKAQVLVTALYPEEEEELYKAGADYVIIPHLLGGQHLAHLLSEHADHLEEYLDSKRKRSS